MQQSVHPPRVRALLLTASRTKTFRRRNTSDALRRTPYAVRLEPMASHALCLTPYALRLAPSCLVPHALCLKAYAYALRRRALCRAPCALRLTPSVVPCADSEFCYVFFSPTAIYD